LSGGISNFSENSLKILCWRVEIFYVEVGIGMAGVTCLIIVFIVSGLIGTRDDLKNSLSGGF